MRTPCAMQQWGKALWEGCAGSWKRTGFLQDGRRGGLAAVAVMFQTRRLPCIETWYPELLSFVRSTSADTLEAGIGGITGSVCFSPTTPTIHTFLPCLAQVHILRVECSAICVAILTIPRQTIQYIEGTHLPWESPRYNACSISVHLSCIHATVLP